MSREAESRPTGWDPAQYGIFSDERSRPFGELITRIPAQAPRHVADLGCGSGELTATLARRWPAAQIEALDSSPEMIAAAQQHALPGRLTFTVADLTTWNPVHPLDVIVSNAVLQWLPEHEDLLPRWAGLLAPGGHLAFQVPGNFDAPSHALLRELCVSPRWRDQLADALRWHPVRDPAGYLDLLVSQGCTVDAWETTYAQILPGEDPVLEWVKGTALRPIITKLSQPEAAEFMAAYATLLRAAYPPASYGTLFPFRRVFIVARPTASALERATP